MATYPHLGACALDLPDGWVDAWKFEKALLKCGDALGSSFNTITIKVPAGCKLMIDVIVRLLSAAVARPIAICSGQPCSPGEVQKLSAESRRASAQSCLHEARGIGHAGRPQPPTHSRQ